MILACLLLSAPLQSEPTVHYQRTIQKAKLEIIQADLTDPRIEAGVELAEDFPKGDQPFAEMVKRPGIIAAVNGAYFDKGTKKPIGDIWVDGELKNFGAMGTALCIKEDGTLDIRRVVRHKRVDWSEFKTVLACGPALVLDGAVDVDYQGEGFRDPHVTGSTSRMGVGYTKAGKLLMVYCPKSVTFTEFAGIMLELGCHEAMNLDAGASLAMWRKGKTIRKAGRELTNLLVIRER